MRFIIYKNNRRYSNIKFTDIDECKEFIKFNGDHDEAASKGWYFDFYEYPSGIYNSDEFNLKNFYNWCNETSKDCNMLVSFDGGTAGDEGFPECNGWTKITNDTGTSKFRRQMSKTREPNKVLKTKESLYVKLK